MHWRQRTAGRMPKNPDASWPCYHLLFQILTGKVAPEEILAIYAGEEICWTMPLTLDDDRPAMRELGLERDEYDRLADHAIQDCPWLETADKAGLLDEMLRGNDDVVCALLVCLCPALVVLLVPEDDMSNDWPRQVSRMTLTIGKIARAYQQSDDHVRKTLPLQCLRTVETPASNGEISFPFHTLPHVLGLPSLQTAILNGAFDDREDEEWPEDAPAPTCPNIYIAYGSFALTTVTTIARAYKTPCVFRQIWISPSIHGVGGSDYEEWRTCHVLLKPDGGTEIKFNLEPEHDCGDESCEHEDWRTATYNDMCQAQADLFGHTLERQRWLMT